MQHDGKILRLIVVIIVLALIGVSNFTYAQQLHDQTLYEITKRTPTQIAHITVGKAPQAIGVSENTNTIYVANSHDDTVSVIDATTHTVIKQIHIPVGKLSDVQHQLLNDKISEYYAKEKSSERYGAPFT